MPKLFNIMDVEYSELIRENDNPIQLRAGNRYWSNSPQLYTTAAAANVDAQRFSEVCHRKFQLRPVKMEGDAWKTREIERLISGEYDQLPWPGLRARDHLNPTPYQHEWTINYRAEEARFHFPHLSKRVKGNIAFTENAEKGAADVQTTMKPGRYLKKFYPTMNAEHIRMMANEIIARFGTCKFELATTPEQIEAVYLNGPNSCMSSRADSYSTGGIHPCSVYGAGDLAVAYLVVMPPENAGASAEETEEDTLQGSFPGTICARALCWPAKKTHGRIYGDTQKMQHFLRENGYEESEGWSFEGARLLRHELRCGTYFVCPYIDGEDRNLRDTGTFLVFDPEGGINGETTSGRAEATQVPVYSCSECGDEFEQGDGFHVRTHPSGTRVWICANCNDYHTFRCRYSGEHFVLTDDNCIEVAGRQWHEYYVERYAFRSAYSDEYFPLSERFTMGNDEYWTLDEAQEHGERSITGMYWPRDEMVTCADGWRRHPSEVSPRCPATPDMLTAINDEGAPINE